MAVEVRIPTILRQYTGGAKTVEGSGDTLSALVDDLESRHPGLRERLIEDGALRRFVNVYLNDEDVRFLDGEKTTLEDGDVVTVLPAVAGGQGNLPRRGRESDGQGNLPRRGRESDGQGNLPRRGRSAAGAAQYAAH